MRKLPEIYKEVVNVNNNRSVFYSKNEDVGNTAIVLEKRQNDSFSVDDLKKIFSLGKNSYTKKVRIKTKDNIYETRLIRRTNGKILTIDNDIIKEEDITSLEIL